MLICDELQIKERVAPQPFLAEMASLADSTAHFDARAAEYQVPEALHRQLVAAGISTLGQLAFAFARPGQEYTDQQFTDWLRDVNLGVAPAMGATAAVRRLHFEAEVIITASLKAAVENPTSDTSTPKPIPQAEKSARMRNLRANLTGVNIEGSLEPANALMEECVQQYDSKILKYIEPARCVSREAELLSVKTDKRLSLDQNSVLKVKETTKIPDADTNSAYALLQCFKRRGLAYEFAQLISYTEHDRYTDSLFRHLSEDPPPGYAPTTMTQLLRADRQVFLYLARTVSDIRPDAAHVKPLHTRIHEALRDYHTSFHLMPLPVNQNYGAWKAAQDTVKDNPWENRKGKGGKGKHKGKGSSMAPRGMVGCVGRDQKGRSICFNYNLTECKGAADGASCAKGRHVCFKANCFKPHAFCKAHANEMPQKE